MANSTFAPFAVPVRPVARSERPTLWVVAAIAVVVAAPLYNGVLALFFAQGFPITTSIVTIRDPDPRRGGFLIPMQMSVFIAGIPRDS